MILPQPPNLIKFYMNISIEVLKPQEVKPFWLTFSQVLTDEFPGYTDNVISYLLEKIYSPSNYYYWLTNNLKTVLVAKIENQIVGFAVIDESYGGVSFCRWLGVKKEHQKKGIGRQLINKWLDLAGNQGCHKVEVAAQPEAKGFYQKVGLNLEGKRELSYFGIDQYIYGKVIGSPNDKTMTQ